MKILLVSAALFLSAFSWQQGLDPLYSQIKTQAEKDLSKFLRQKVTAQSASGRVVGSFVLNEVKIENLGTVGKMTFHFNPAKYLASKGDMIPALTKIVIEKGDFFIRRETLTLFAPPEKGQPAPKAKNVFRNCKIIYTEGDNSLSLDGVDGETGPGNNTGKFSFSSVKGNFQGGSFSAAGEVSFDLRRQVAAGAIAISEGSAFNQKFSGKTQIAYEKNLLKITADKIKFNGGRANLRAEIDLRAPKASISAAAFSASIFGLPFEELEANLTAAEGKFILNSARLSSDNSLFFASGELFPVIFLKASGNIGGITLDGKVGLDGLTNLVIAGENTKMTLSGKADKKRNVDFILSGAVDLSDFREMTDKYGRFSGRIITEARISGPVDNLRISSPLTIEDLKINEIYLDSISGECSYRNQKLTLPSLNLSQKDDAYLLAGEIDFAPLIKGRPLDTPLALNLKIVRGNLANIFRLAEKIQSEVRRRINPVAAGRTLPFNFSSLVLPAPAGFSTWTAVADETEARMKTVPEENLGGKISGGLRLEGKISRLSGTLEARIDEGYFRNYRFDSLRARLGINSKGINLEGIALTKKSGWLELAGGVGFDGELNLTLQAKNYPLDILSLLSPREFEGSFNLEAEIGGTLERPEISAGAAASRATLAGIVFERTRVSFSADEDGFRLHDLLLQESQYTSRGSGFFPTAAGEKIDLNLELEGNAPGLLNLFTDKVRWLEGKSKIKVKIGGTPDNPVMSGTAALNDVSVFVKDLDSKITGIAGKASLKNNVLAVKELSGTWFGDKTRYAANYIGLTGNAVFDRGDISLNLAFSPTTLTVEYPNIYSGTIKIRDAGLEGSLSDLTLKGTVDLEDAVIYLPKERKESPPQPLNLQLLLSLKKNVYATWGDVATLDLSNIFLNLELLGDNLEINGNLSSPAVLGNILIKRGSINIFNREFQIVDAEAQKKFYPNDPGKIRENSVNFAPAEGLQPRLSVAAAANIENIEKDIDGKPIRKKVIILSYLKGVLGAREKEKGLEISFAGFAEDRAKTPPEVNPAAYSEADIRVMLLPDYIKALTGLSAQPDARVDTNVIVADYLTSRLQTIVFRRVEREIEKFLGLESLSLEYNFGKDIRQSLGIDGRERELSPETPAWGVGFAKGLFDRLYVDVKYSQSVEELAVGTKTTFNYQLTYKFNPVWSIMYYREPRSLTELTTGYQKVTLKAKFSLW